MKDIITDEKIRQRFDDKYVPDPMSGCWLWTAKTHACGYGIISINNRPELAHRVSVKLSGRDVAGKVVRHKCDNPACVNPDHLLTGSQSDNMADKVAKDRQQKGERCHQSNLTQADIKHIRSVAVKGFGGNIKSLCEQYGITTTSMLDIVNRKTWNHVR